MFSHADLADRHKLFNETELKLIHQGLIHLSANYSHLTAKQMITVGKIMERIEMLVPAIREYAIMEYHELVPEDELEV